MSTIEAGLEAGTYEVLRNRLQAQAKALAAAAEGVNQERLRVFGGAELRLLSTVSTFGTPLDVTVEELSVESFFPADEATAGHLRRAAR